MPRWVPVALLLALIAIALVSTHWVPLVIVLLLALGFLVYEYAWKR